MGKAIIVLDYIKDIASENGKLATKGYYNFIKENNVIVNLTKDLEHAKNNGWKVIFVKVSFKENYEDQPKNSPLFGKANEFEVLKSNSFGVEFIEELSSFKPDLVLIKNRVSAFSNKDLINYLKLNDIKDLYLAGVATDLAVLSTAFDAHDSDFNVTILSKSCAAANKEDHENALTIMSKFSKI